MIYKNGSKGEFVKRIQTVLNVKADGIYGKKTEAAVKEFQKANSLKADGICGPCTLAKLGLIKDVNLRTKDLKQFDSRWADECYGKKGWKMPQASFRKAGCGCISAVICWFYYFSLVAAEIIKEPSVSSVVHMFADEAIRKGYRIEGNGTSYKIFGLFGLTYKKCNEAEAEDALRNGKLVVVCVKSGWSTYKNKGHYVVLHGIEGDCFLVNDVGSSAISRQKVNMNDWKYVKSAYIVDYDPATLGEVLP